MKKSDREKIFNKYGGKCAYCGEALEKGWHVDEIKPVIRKKKIIHAHWRNKNTGEVVDIKIIRQLKEDDEFWNNCQYVESKTVNDGYEYPERLHIDNQNPACASCNINKRGQSIEEFRSFIKGFLKHLNTISTQYKIAKRYGLIKETNIEVKFYFETVETERNNTSISL